MRIPLRITALALVLAVSGIGTAQAEPFNIFSASKAQQATQDQSVQLEQARYYRRGYRGYRGYGYRRGWNPGAAFALGTIGTIAGIAAYNSRYYCDPYYEYCGPRRVYRRYYGPPRYYGPRPYRYY